MTVAEISELVALITSLLGLIGMVVAYVRKVYKTIKEKNLKQFIEEQMEIAEQTEIDGKQKLLMVVSAVEERYGLKEYLKIEKEVKDYIEECIAFSKKINSNEK